MKKSLFPGLIALAALTMTSCSNDENMLSIPQDNAIEFGTYLGRDAQTKASVFETADMQNAGFGVYAFYTGGSDWENYGQKNAPNFMNNTKVTFTDPYWTYAPVKYWPNNVGDKVSFFAYAPWQKNEDGSNITLNNGDASLDFIVQNVVTNQTDLTWSATNNMNKTKQTTTGTVNFEFKHALSRIDFTLQAAVDQVEAGGTIAEGTVITLNKIMLGTNENGFYTSGTLDLTQENATWTNLTGEQVFTLTDENFIEGSNLINSETNGKASLIDKDEKDYIMIIPETFTAWDVYVEYTVATNEGKTDPSVIENRITTTIEDFEFEAGKAYTFNRIRPKKAALYFIT